MQKSERFDLALSFCDKHSKYYSYMVENMFSCKWRFVRARVSKGDLLTYVDEDEGVEYCSGAEYDRMVENVTKSCIGFMQMGAKKVAEGILTPDEFGSFLKIVSTPGMYLRDTSVLLQTLLVSEPELLMELSHIAKMMIVQRLCQMQDKEFKAAMLSKHVELLISDDARTLMVERLCQLADEDFQGVLVYNPELLIFFMFISLNDKAQLLEMIVERICQMLDNHFKVFMQSKYAELVVGSDLGRVMMIGRICKMGDEHFQAFMLSEHVAALAVTEHVMEALVDRICRTRDLSWVTVEVVRMLDVDNLIILMRSGKTDTMTEPAREELEVRAQPDTARTGF